MLQCQNYILADQAGNYQTIAETAAVRVAKSKYKKRGGKVDSKKVPAVTASAKAHWDPDTWDADIWDNIDGDQEDWDELEEEA